MSRVLAGAVAAAVAVAVAGAHGSSRPTTFSLVARQAQEVAVTTRFVNAFDTHNLRLALATFAPSAAGSDCDYRRGRVVTFRGTQGVAAWLRSRFADGDYLGIDRVWNGNTESPVGVLAVDWKIRRSATLRRLGFPRGIVPELSAKVVFTQGPRPRIKALGNGPVGGDPSSCRPR
jgi:hypothetical protein